jgi:hypothetical protein
MTESRTSLHVLQQLEEGRIDVDEAVRRLDAPPAAGPRTDAAARRSRTWWLVPLAIGMAFLGAGGWLASQAGAWWVAGIPLLLVGVVLTVLAAASSQSPWASVRLRSAGGPGTRLWLPIPIRAAAWAVPFARPWMPPLAATSVDDLLLSLEEELGSGRDLIIEVDESGEGERVRVSFE